MSVCVSTPLASEVFLSTAEARLVSGKVRRALSNDLQVGSFKRLKTIPFLDREKEDASLVL